MIQISKIICSTIVTFWANVSESIDFHCFDNRIVQHFHFSVSLFSSAGECTVDKDGSPISQIDSAAIASMTANKSNRHSFCEYKPFSARKCDLQKLKFLTPNLYKSNQDECDKLAHLNDDLSTQDGQFDLLPLIGESKLALTHTPPPNKLNDANGDDPKTSPDLNIECT